MKRYFYQIALAMTIIIGLLIIVLANSSHLKSEEFESLKSTDFNSGWKYQIEQGEIKEISKLPAAIDGAKENKTIYLYNSFVELKDKEILVFRTNNQKVKVFIDDKLVYKFGDEKIFFLKTPGSKWNIVHLNATDSHKEIRVEVTSVYSSRPGYVKSFTIGGEEEVRNSIIRSRIPIIFVFLVILFTGVVCIVFNRMLDIEKKGKGGIIYVGIFLCLLGVWTLLEAQVLEFVINKPSLLLLMSCICNMMIPLPIILYAKKSIFEKDSKVIKILYVIGLLNLPLQTILQFLEIYDYYEMCTISHIIMVLFGVCIAVKYIMNKHKEYKENRHKKEKGYLIMAGILVSLVFGSLALFSFYLSYSFVYITYMFYAILIVAVVLIQYHKKCINRLEEKIINADLYKKLAYEDSLTKCHNRAYFDKELKEAMDTVTEETQIVIMSFDMNNLKYNNDRFGHAVGDALIYQCAKCITNALMGKATVCRIGGDEFSVILKDVTEEYIQALIRRIEKNVEDYNNNSIYELSFAYGYAIYNRKTDKNLEAVLSRADSKMYNKKRSMKEAIEEQEKN